MTPATPIILWALDFDGVVCDSARETGAAAWRAGRRLWPQDWTAPEPPAAVLDGFCELRPRLETGYQAILMLRLLTNGQSPAAVRADFHGLLEQTLAATGRTVPELVKLFGDARDRWIAADPEGWLARHRFYPGVPETLAAALRNPHATVFILTTKQARFTERLLRAAGVDLAAERIFGLETGRKKPEILAELLARPEHAGAECRFVEDRLDALDAAAARPELNRVRLILAPWGYASPDDQARAAANPRMESWPLARFTAALSGGTASAPETP